MIKMNINITFSPTTALLLLTSMTISGIKSHPFVPKMSNSETSNFDIKTTSEIVESDGGTVFPILKPPFDSSNGNGSAIASPLPDYPNNNPGDYENESDDVVIVEAETSTSANSHGGNGSSEIDTHNPDDNSVVEGCDELRQLCIVDLATCPTYKEHCEANNSIIQDIINCISELIAGGEDCPNLTG